MIERGVHYGHMLAVAACMLCIVCMPVYGRIEIVDVLNGSLPTYVCSFGMHADGTVNSSFVEKPNGARKDIRYVAVNISVCTSKEFQELYHASSYQTSSYVNSIYSSMVRSTCTWSFPVGENITVPQDGLYFIFAYGSVATVNVTVMNPGNQHLSVGESALPATSVVFSVIWSTCCCAYIISAIVARRKPENRSGSRQPIIILLSLMILRACGMACSANYWLTVADKGFGNEGLQITSIVISCFVESTIYAAMLLMSRGVFIVAARFERRRWSPRDSALFVCVLIVLLLNGLYDQTGFFYYGTLALYMMLFPNIYAGTTQLSKFFSALFTAYLRMRMNVFSLMHKLIVTRIYKIVCLLYITILFCAMIPGSLIPYDLYYICPLLREIASLFALISLAALTHPYIFRSVDIVSDILESGLQRRGIRDSRARESALEQITHPFIILSPGNHVYAGWEKKKKRKRSDEDKLEEKEEESTQEETLQ